MTADQIRAVLDRHSFTVSNELELHEALDDVLTLAFPGSVEREVTQRNECNVTLGRIDFMIYAVGIEVKVAGQPAEVRRQLQRYQRSPRVVELLLVTTRGRHLTMLPGGCEAIVIGGLVG